MTTAKKILAEKNLKIALYAGAVVLAEYWGEEGGYENTRLLDFGNNSRTAIYPENSRYWSDTSLKYHSSWQWLMPVVQKAISESDEHDDGAFRFYLKDIFPFDNIESTWEALISYLNDTL